MPASLAPTCTFTGTGLEKAHTDATQAQYASSDCGYSLFARWAECAADERAVLGRFEFPAPAPAAARLWGGRHTTSGCSRRGYHLEKLPRCLKVGVGQHFKGRVLAVR